MGPVGTMGRHPLSASGVPRRSLVRACPPDREGHPDLCIAWVIIRTWETGDQLEKVPNLFANLSTIFRLAKTHARGAEFVNRLTLPPKEFERQLRASV